MVRFVTSCLVGLVFLGGVSLSEAAQKKNRRTAYLSAKEAGPDFVIQGEYVGKLVSEEGKKNVGVQVIALGDGKFRAVLYSGGLPGAGWDRSEEKLEVDGRVEGKKAVFKAEEGTGVIQDGVLTVTTSDGVELGTLKKITRKSKTLGEKAPEGAVVLFDGSSATNFQKGRMTKDGLLMEGTTSKQKFQSFKLHFEFQLSFMPYARGQGRSNSGVYMQGRYECQILDSFGLAGKQNECGGIYSIKDPAVNMCFPPLSWQTYDIEFTAAKFDSDGKKIKNAYMTVWHNGVKIHDNVELPKTTTAAPVRVGPEPGPIYIQNHGNPIRFRNIWLVERK
ncbi:MAG: DUF1080 domain-containing protein [Gemmataceae bacterium]